MFKHLSFIALDSGIEQVAVIGGSKANRDELFAAEEVGRLIALNGWQLICGGHGGVMEAACRGAKSVGGTTIGILPGRRRSLANEFVDIAVATGIGIARNSIIAHSADAAIAVAGSYGTLSEIAYFLQLKRPVVTLFCQWDIHGVMVSRSPGEAVELIGGAI